MITKERDTTTTTTKWQGITFGIETILSDYDQIVIDVPVFQSGYSNTTGHWTTYPTGETFKWRLEKIEYSLQGREYDAVSISSLYGRGFTKAKTLRVHGGGLYTDQITDEVLAQIPVHYHDKAKEQFLATAKELTEQMKRINANGLSLIPNKR